VDLERTCVVCGKRFLASRVDAKACSQACRTRLSRSRRSSADGGAPPRPTSMEAGTAGSAVALVLSGLVLAAMGRPTASGQRSRTRALGSGDGGPPQRPGAMTSAAALLEGGEADRGRASPPDDRVAPGVRDRLESASIELAGHVAPGVGQDRKQSGHRALKGEQMGPERAGRLPDLQAGAAAKQQQRMAEGDPHRAAPVPTPHKESAGGQAQLLLPYVQDRAVWEALLARGGDTVARLCFALAKAELAKSLRAHRAALESEHGAGLLAIDELLAADPALRTAFNRAHGPSLVGVRMALAAQSRVGARAVDADEYVASVEPSSGDVDGPAAAGVSAGTLGPEAERELARRRFGLPASTSVVPHGGPHWPGSGGPLPPDRAPSAGDPTRTAAGAEPPRSTPALDRAGDVFQDEIERLRAEVGALQGAVARSRGETASVLELLGALNAAVARRAIEVAELQGAVELHSVELGKLRSLLTAGGAAQARAEGGGGGGS
jgi:hypothetical protein